MVVFDAVILAGGPSARLGGADKALVSFGGVTLFERAVAAVRDAERIIGVGPQRDVGLSAGVTWVQEDPPGGGPVAALAAGLSLVAADLVAVLAVDHPLITGEHIATLLASVSRDGAMALDDRRRRQPLLAVYRSAALRTAMLGLPLTQGASLRALTNGLALEQVNLGDAAIDCDTWEAIEAAGMVARRTT
jgi:molybdopterin-guanine dinucleotide biosynthesis protein A